MNVQLVCSTPPSVRMVIITFSHHGVLDAHFVAALEACPSWSALDEAIVGCAHIAQLVCVVDQDINRSLSPYVGRSCWALGFGPSHKAADDEAETREDGYFGVLKRVLHRTRTAGKLRVVAED